jgi:pyrroloquinoline quinone (PQQ) biosynthesis protein C
MRDEISDDPLPAWISEVKVEAAVKITAAAFACACRQADLAVMRGLIVGLWPFVNKFPRCIMRGVAKVSKTSAFNERELLNTLLYRSSQSLTRIQRDEENHRKLWLEAGRALGLDFPHHFNRAIPPETQTWINAVNAAVDPFTLLVRFAAIEIIAETVSVDFLASKAFTSTLGQSGCEWFRVHAAHEQEITHEELELRLAFGFLEGPPDELLTNQIIQHIVNFFVAAADASATIAT